MVSTAISVLAISVAIWLLKLIVRGLSVAVTGARLGETYAWSGGSMSTREPLAETVEYLKIRKDYLR
jgi:hypothetical protein